MQILLYTVVAIWVINSRALVAILRNMAGTKGTQKHSKEAGCRHPEVEHVEVGDGIVVPREVVAKICTSCYEQLSADYESPHSVIMTNEESAPFPYHTIDLRYWTEESERLVRYQVEE